ncbi:MAG TPA: sulfite exporter TauE/SafE family protein [Candidatus Levilactobacillus faecigallinarum]|uniref:Probable membrane transporter protein n=1 Tax=Candidatus Levilactobacillus faecigallinarum TaxID=2838638 RepID=A0A9D1QQK8_9LACO|nr:sulfite exporter TauE/SafE family protein [Candidatus Levilactobacillus faecigallinarum]
MLTILFLIGMSLVAGILTGIVGMASLTLYPVLISVGLAPITANATITVAQVGAGLGTLLSSLKELRHHWKQAIEIATLNTIGGVFGAILLIHSSNDTFKKIVPFFVMLAGVMILAPKVQNHQREMRILTLINQIGIFLVGIYNGYFGAASGLLMIAILSRAVHEKFVTYNAMRNFASFTNNIVAAGLFMVKLPIDWAVIIPLLAGLFVGGLIGPVIVRVIPAKIIKNAVGVFALILAGILGWTTYF